MSALSQVSHTRSSKDFPVPESNQALISDSKNQEFRTEGRLSAPNQDPRTLIVNFIYGAPCLHKMVRKEDRLTLSNHFIKGRYPLGLDVL